MSRAISNADAVQVGSRHDGFTLPSEASPYQSLVPVTCGRCMICGVKLYFSCCAGSPAAHASCPASPAPHGTQLCAADEKYWPWGHSAGSASAR